MAIVAGKNVTFYINAAGVWLLYACAKSCSLQVNTSTVETSVTGSGKWATFMPQKHSWSGTIDGVVNLDHGATISLHDLRKKQINMDVLLIKFERKNNAGGDYTDTGSCIITGSSDSGSIDDVAMFSISLQGTGALVQSFI